MKPDQGKKALTLGDLIESGYRACGKRRASGLIRLAAEARLIVFEKEVPPDDLFQGNVNEVAMPLSASSDQNAPPAAEGRPGSTPIFT